MAKIVYLRSGELTIKQRKEVRLINSMLNKIERYCSDLLQDDIVGAEDLSELRSEVDNWSIKIVNN